MHSQIKMNNKNIDFIFFSGDNGVDFPKGGITSFTRQMMRVFGNRMAIVGISTDDTPVGKWVNRTFNGEEYLFFSIAKLDKDNIKPFIPQRLSSYFQLKKYKNDILKLDTDNAFVQNSHFLLAIKDWKLANKAYVFHGATNPLKKARYPFANLIAPVYEKKMFRRLKNYNSIFVAADDTDIDNLIQRSKNLLAKEKIVKLPTRFDNTIFYPSEKELSLQKLGMKHHKNIFVQVGRISKQKGCDFILEAFDHFLKKHPDSALYFVGDGEERDNIQNKINRLGLSENVKITGFIPTQKVALYYNAANVVLVGSYMEGWSIAMVEALACGKNIVSTKVSGARDMIIEGKNGFVVEKRVPELFSEKMEEATNFPFINKASLEKAEAYSLTTLKEDIQKNWTII